MNLKRNALYELGGDEQVSEVIHGGEGSMGSEVSAGCAKKVLTGC